jgi:phosphoenolpyruvate---glycerone phosphotransferase subunit DhaK
MEMGVGIHGEPGRRREKLASANEIVDELLEAAVTDLPFGAGDDVALMVNGLGATPISELSLLHGYAHELLAQRGINVRRNYVGNYCTSLDMAGTSITLSRLDPEIEGLLAAPAQIAIRTFRRPGAARQRSGPLHNGGRGGDRCWCGGPPAARRAAHRG